MKKIIAFLFVIAIYSHGFAQDVSSGPEFRKHRFGLKGTPGVSYFTMGKNGSKNKGLGYHLSGGLNYEYCLNKSTAIATGILFSQTSGGVSYTDSVGLEFSWTSGGQKLSDNAFMLLSRRYVFNSVDIPLKLKFRAAEVGYFTYYAEFGATANIITKAITKKNDVIMNSGELQTTISENEGKFDANDETRFYRGAVNVGAGVEWNLVGNTSLLLGANANIPFTNLLTKESGSISYMSGSDFTRATKLNYISLQIGIQF
ncbi:MAG: hypothetical protein CMP61_11850 [Flavobacteriales bacterium]|nr:hypothetical protein [Flavobacteriales bacterium]|tara:strand:+ start:967 stop:1740 length:774 start_codon:yes stop_codon:yes gene_type:complete